MKVYILIDATWDGPILLGVFPTKDLADQEVQRLKYDPLESLYKPEIILYKQIGDGYYEEERW